MVSYPSAEIQSVYPTVPINWATGHTLAGDLTSQQRFSRCIRQSLPTGPQDTRWRGILPLIRDSVGVFDSPYRLGHRTHIGGGSYLSAEIQSVYSTVPTDWATGHTLAGDLTSQQRFSRCNRQSLSTGPQDTRWRGILPLCRDAVGVFDSPYRLGHRTHVGGGSYPSAEMQSVYSTVPADWVFNRIGKTY